MCAKHPAPKSVHGMCSKYFTVTINISEPNYSSGNIPGHVLGQKLDLSSIGLVLCPSAKLVHCKEFVTYVK